MNLNRTLHPFMYLSFLITAVCITPFGLAAEERVILNPTEAGLNLWVSKEFSGLTQYEAIQEDGRNAIKATAKASGSAMYRTIDIDIEKYPILEWSWKVDKLPTIGDEKSKQGDDYAVRVYIVVKDGWLPWQVKSINYVWSGQAAVDDTWPNPFTNNVVMRAMDSGSDNLSKWRSHRVNMAEDFKAKFGKPFNSIEGIAFMTDTDNSGTTATAFYGKIVVRSE